MLSPAPLIAILLGKVLAETLSAARPAAAAFVVGLFLTGGIGEIASIPWTIASGLVAILAVICLSFVQGPWTILAGASLGAIKLRTTMMVLSGFLYPVAILPDPIEVLARLLPTSWAMSALIDSIGQGGTFQTAVSLFGALAICAVYLALSAIMFVKVEARVRATGSLR